MLAPHWPARHIPIRNFLNLISLLQTKQARVGVGPKEKYLMPRRCGVHQIRLQAIPTTASRHVSPVRPPARRRGGKKEINRGESKKKKKRKKESSAPRRQTFGPPTGNIDRPILVDHDWMTDKWLGPSYVRLQNGSEGMEAGLRSQHLVVTKQTRGMVGG